MEGGFSLCIAEYQVMEMCLPYARSLLLLSLEPDIARGEGSLPGLAAPVLNCPGRFGIMQPPQIQPEACVSLQNETSQ